jgi:hypothetical protein
LGGEEEGLKMSALVASVPTTGAGGWTNAAEGTERDAVASLFASDFTSFLSFLMSTLVVDAEGEGPESVLLLFDIRLPNRPTDGFFSRTGTLWLFSMVGGRSVS